MTRVVGVSQIIGSLVVSCSGFSVTSCSVDESLSATSVRLVTACLVGDIRRLDFVAPLGEWESDLFFLLLCLGLPGGGDLAGAMSMGGRLATK